MTVHPDQSPLAGTEVKIKTSGQTFRVVDWADRCLNEKVSDARSNGAALQYTVRAALELLPKDDEILYGYTGDLGHMAHMSEIEL